MLEFTEILKKLAEQSEIEISESALANLGRYYLLLDEESKKYNLTAIKDTSEMAERNFLDSLFLTKVEIPEGANVTDIGSGAGFPGIPLKLVRPDLNVVLMDSQNKKVEFLKKVITALGLENIEAVCVRAEEAGRDPRYREQSDIVVSRAVADMRILAELSLPMIRQGGHFLAMKSARSRQESENSSEHIRLLGGEIEAYYQYRLPVSGREFEIAIINKVNRTPDKYPRKYSTIKKQAVK